jgi:RNA polymerase sigma-70 factor (ECF subfamily)
VDSATLVSRVQILSESGRPDALELDSLYTRIAAEFGPALSRLDGGYEANPALRQDLLQDIHVALWRSLAGFDRRCAIGTWVYRVAHNAAQTHLSRHRRHRQSFCTLDELENLPSGHDTETHTNREQAVHRLSDLIGRLESVDRQVILLYLEELDAASIASVTGLTAGNIATKIHRIKALLARQFHAEGADHA